MVVEFLSDRVVRNIAREVKVVESKGREKRG
jgi:hypothetical protein